MYCPNGCSVWAYPQPMEEVTAGVYTCPQCYHEIRDNDPDFKCQCQICSKTPAPQGTLPDEQVTQHLISDFFEAGRGIYEWIKCLEPSDLNKLSDAVATVKEVKEAAHKKQQ